MNSKYKLMSHVASELTDTLPPPQSSPPSHHIGSVSLTNKISNIVLAPGIGGKMAPYSKSLIARVNLGLQISAGCTFEFDIFTKNLKLRKSTF